MKILLMVLSTALILILSPGCTSTITPDPIHISQPSWDAGQQTSGFIAFDADGYGIITPHARDRYNGLIAIYGRDFIPPVKPDDGLTPAPPNYRIDPEHLSKFATMNRWRKQGKTPK